MGATADAAKAAGVKAAVCDASVLFKLLVPEQDSDKVTRLVGSIRVFVPDFAFVEIGNALWSRVRRKDLALTQATILLSQLRALNFEVTPAADLITHAFFLATQVNHPVYDCLYLALAEYLGIPLITGDARFMAALSRSKSITADVRVLADVA